MKYKKLEDKVIVYVRSSVEKSQKQIYIRNVTRQSSRVLYYISVGTWNS